jgi:uncharacterized protein (TIGR02996 family)
MVAPPNLANVPSILSAISAAPADDAPRLVLADWLQEERHPWGELIAVQCALGRISPHATERVALLRREHELLASREWWPFEGAGFHVESFARGLPRAIRVESLDGLRAVSERMPWLPVLDDVEIPLAAGDVDALARFERLPARGITLEATQKYAFHRDDARTFVRWLERTGQELVRFGARRRANRHALDTVFDAIGARLEDIELTNIKARAQGPWIDTLTLRRLTLRGVSFDGFHPEVGANLEAVELSSMMLERRAPDLVQWLRRVERLDLASVGLDDFGLGRIVDHPPAKLRALGVARNRLGPESFERLARLDVDVLDVARTGLTERDALVLARSPALPPTLVLTVSATEAGGALGELRERFAVVIAA